MNIGDFAADLESAIDQFGLESVVNTMADIATGKGLSICTERGLNGKWHQFARLCHSLCARIPDAIR